MSDQIKITVNGMDKVMQAFRKAPATVGRMIHDSVEDAAQEVSRQAKIALTVGPNRAIDTGRLRASIGGGKWKAGSFSKGEGISVSQFSATVGPTVDYAIYVHEGTRRMRARPFMIEARDKSQSGIQKIFETNLAQVFN